MKMNSASGETVHGSTVFLTKLSIADYTYEMNVWPGPDLSVWRPWAGPLLEAPTHPQMQYNLHALTIVIITKYIYIYFYTL